MTLSEDLTWRGLIKDKTFDDAAWINEAKTFYWGVDCSSDSLTVGNLAPLMLAKRLSLAGWKAVLLVGGATSLIGDPGGKDAERPLLPREEVEKNVAAIKAQVSGLFEGQEFQLVDNYDWFKDVGYLDFLRDVGKHFPMSELIQREFIAERMGEDGGGISYAEFSYSLIQGYDFWQLFKNQGTVLQIGGSDQWGNMLSGVALIRKKESAEANALSMPLVVNKETGKKFGKSEDAAIWLDPAKTTATEFYQFWINTDDADVEEYLKFFTLLTREEIERVMAEQQADPGQRAAQKKLAEEVTKLVHGDSSESAEGVTKYLTSQVSIGEASDEELEKIRHEIPSVLAGPGAAVVAILVNAKLASSNSDARRLLAAKAVYINGQQIQKENFEESDFQNGRLLLRRGKAFKDSALVELN